MSVAMKTAMYGTGQTSKSFLGALGGAIGGFVTGGPGGAIIGGLAGAGVHLGGGSQPSGPSVSAPVTPVPGIGGAVARLIPGGKTGYEAKVPQTTGDVRAPSGHHWNKSSYFLKDGTFVPKGTKLVKNRRRNSANPRALSRALSRLNGAKRLQHRLSGFATDKYTASGKRKKSCG